MDYLNKSKKKMFIFRGKINRLIASLTFSPRMHWKDFEGTHHVRAINKGNNNRVISMILILASNVANKSALTRNPYWGSLFWSEFFILSAEWYICYGKQNFLVEMRVRYSIRMKLNTHTRFCSKYIDYTRVVTNKDKEEITIIQIKPRRALSKSSPVF